MQSTIEIFDRGQWQPCCIVETENPSAGSQSPSVLTYLPAYAENGSLPVSIHFPVRREPYHLAHWPSFLLDMVPRGEGREYLLYECHIPEEVATDWKLMLYGAINPIGNLRLRKRMCFTANLWAGKRRFGSTGGLRSGKSLNGAKISWNTLKSTACFRRERRVFRAKHPNS